MSSTATLSALLPRRRFGSGGAVQPALSPVHGRLVQLDARFSFKAAVTFEYCRAGGSVATPSL